MRTAVYLRISRDKEGRKLGVERQQRDCEELAKELGLTVDQIFMDNVHGNRINICKFDREGSGFVGRRAPDFLIGFPELDCTFSSPSAMKRPRFHAG